MYVVWMAAWSKKVDVNQREEDEHTARERKGYANNNLHTGSQLNSQLSLTPYAKKQGLSEFKITSQK